tara:strand:+ start:338 stop:1282 length:945 start_codon:yes stop_codon:yes gene_type:complete
MKVFQEKSGNLTEFKGLGGKKDFDYEKEIQKLIENNLNTVFPNLEFITTEYRIDNLRPDSVAFDIESNAFVIIEYKNVKHRGVLDQGMSYYQLLQEKKENFVLLYQKVKGKLISVEEINWDETKIIFISPIFDEHQKRANMSSALPIELYEIKKYENDLITLNRLENGSKSSVSKNGGDGRYTKVKLDEYDVDDYLNGKYHSSCKASDEIKSIYKKMLDIISDSFENLEFKQKKMYGGFYSMSDGQSICTFVTRGSKLRFYYSTRKPDLISVSDFVQKAPDNHWGLGNFVSDVSTEEDIKNTIPFIELVYSDKM